MRARHFLCPLSVLVDNEEERVYGANGLELPRKPPAALMLVVTLILMFAIIASLVGMFKAFGCGDSQTNFGLTGTGWGVLMVIMLLFATPAGGILGLAFAIGGKCAS